jgi:predicted ester cyclase
MIRGIHMSELMGIPPTGKPVTWTGITIYRLADGKIVEEKGKEDSLGLMQQLGAIPAPTQAG